MLMHKRYITLAILAAIALFSFVTYNYMAQAKQRICTRENSAAPGNYNYNECIAALAQY